MQLFLTSNKKRIQKDFVLILFIYSTLNITKKGKGGKKKKTLCSSMPEICHHIRRSIDDMEKNLADAQKSKGTNVRLNQFVVNPKKKKKRRKETRKRKSSKLHRILFQF